LQIALTVPNIESRCNQLKLGHPQNYFWIANYVTM
jgi:G:T/U-mismatch repair DNA glycosylase